MVQRPFFPQTHLRVSCWPDINPLPCILQCVFSTRAFSYIITVWLQNQGDGLIHEYQLFLGLQLLPTAPAMLFVAKESSLKLSVTFSYYVSILSFVLEPVLSLSLTFMTLTLLKSTGQSTVECLSMCVSTVSSCLLQHIHMFGRISEVMLSSHCIPPAHTWVGLVSLQESQGLITWLRQHLPDLYTLKLLFPFVISTYFEGSYFETMQISCSSSNCQFIDLYVLSV